MQDCSTGSSSSSAGSTSISMQQLHASTSSAVAGMAASSRSRQSKSQSRSRSRSRSRTPPSSMTGSPCCSADAGLVCCDAVSCATPPAELEENEQDNCKECLQGIPAVTTAAEECCAAAGSGSGCFKVPSLPKSCSLGAKAAAAKDCDECIQHPEQVIEACHDPACNRTETGGGDEPGLLLEWDKESVDELVSLGLDCFWV